MDSDVGGLVHQGLRKSLIFINMSFLPRSTGRLHSLRRRLWISESSSRIGVRGERQGEGLKGMSATPKLVILGTKGGRQQELAQVA